MVQKRDAASAKHVSSNAAVMEARIVMGTDELSWAAFQSTVSCSLLSHVASDLLTHGRTHYFCQNDGLQEYPRE